MGRVSALPYSYMFLSKIQDYRNPIQKLSRKELEYLARYENRADIEDGMPAELMKAKFEAQPPAQYPRPMRDQLGSQAWLRVPPYEEWVKTAFSRTSEPQEQTVNETDSVSDLENQWLAQKAQEIDFSELPFWQLKQECKKRGIKFTRTDKKKDLLGKLNGENAS